MAIVPLLDFSYPISLDDHEHASDILRILRDSFGATVAVFGQNRASNEIMAWRLHARGFTSLLDSDLDDDWERARAARPDFLFVSLGGDLAESVNPPPDLLSCGVVLAPGHRPLDVFDRVQTMALANSGHSESTAVDLSRTTNAVSRVVQAAGRLHRSPEDLRPVFLVNKAFGAPDFLRLWPRNWYRRRPQELLFDSLADAQAHMIRADDAN